MTRFRTQCFYLRSDITLEVTVVGSFVGG